MAGLPPLRPAPPPPFNPPPAWPSRQSRVDVGSRQRPGLPPLRPAPPPPFNPPPAWPSRQRPGIQGGRGVAGLPPLPQPRPQRIVTQRSPNAGFQGGGAERGSPCRGGAGHPPHDPVPHATPVAPPAHPPPQSRRASDPSRQRPCHPPLALAPRRLYTSPMRKPTSAYPRLPDAARGTSPRSTNCPESRPPYPQNGSWWTRRIVSAADSFEADSFPKKENLGGGTNRRSSARPEGPSPASTPATAARTCAAPTRRRPGTPTPYKAVAPPAHPPPQSRRASDPSRQRPVARTTTHALSSPQHHSEAREVAIPQKNKRPFCSPPASFFRKKTQLAIMQAGTIKSSPSPNLRRPVHSREESGDPRLQAPCEISSRDRPQRGRRHPAAHRQRGKGSG